MKDRIVRRLDAVVLTIRAKEKGTVSRSLEDRNKVG